MSDFKVIKNHDQEKFEKEVNQELNNGYKIINCSYAPVGRKNYYAFIIKD